jgi:hypothetical protein
MWVFTREGFVSVVQYRGQPETLLVRSRDAAHLKALNETYDIQGQYLPTAVTADYQARMTVSRARWAHAMTQMVEAIDYPNFKEMVGQDRPADVRYLTGLIEVWTTLFDVYSKPRD